MLKRVSLFLIKGYRSAVSPFFPKSCRHIPSCSAYAQQAVEAHGAFKGGWMALKRICRCHPWGTFGFDPVNKSER